MARRASLYSTIVDGVPWRLESHLCGFVPPGTNRLGRSGADRVFVELGTPADSSQGLNRSVSVRHHVDLVGWLPGTNHRISAGADVQLDCPAHVGGVDR
ncbi:MAG: hypothetical protein IPK07_20320 [Deltaproteobacteria bacterium]|nr:hypothetical protein [Deltaproteobacteria bacterium]